MSKELDVMRSFALACEVIKETVIQNVQSSALRGDLKITKEDFAKLNSLIRESIDQAARNSSKQLQSAVNKK